MMSATLPKHRLFDLYAESLAAAEHAVHVWGDLYRTSADLAFWWAERWAGLPHAFAAWTPVPTATPGAVAATAAPLLEPSPPTPEPVPSPRVVEAAPADPDDLTRIVGIGPRLAAALAERGIASFAQIANWTDAEAAEVDRELKLMGRIARNGWVIQARRLTTAG